MKKIALSKLNDLLTAISTSTAVFAPQCVKGSVNYDVWSADSAVVLEKTTVKSAKDVFFPQVENMMEFKTEGKNISIEQVNPSTDKFVVFGVRACDVKSFSILDSVFMVAPKDSFYTARRNNGTVVSLACNKPDETCFCTTFKIEAHAPKGDVETYIVGDELYWLPLTAKGEALTAVVSDMLEDADATAVDAVKEDIKVIMTKLPLADLSLDGFGQDKVKELFNRPEWEALSNSCVGCGTCTYVCPTCQCYDIRDYNTGKEVKRYRCWDSCMVSDFTMMAHGNIRPNKVQRFRQRFMHKLAYYPDNNNGEFSCVGCGRCLAKCPVSMNIVKVIKTIGGK
ncbi:MAG: 4Fe-4S dicluster domain-containing protein [Bacillota bacterium]